MWKSTIKRKLRKINKNRGGFSLKKNRIEYLGRHIGNIEGNQVNIRYYNFSSKGLIDGQIEYVNELKNSNVPYREVLVRDPLRKLYGGDEKKAIGVLKSALMDFGNKGKDLASRVDELAIEK